MPDDEYGAMPPEAPEPQSVDEPDVDTTTPSGDEPDEVTPGEEDQPLQQPAARATPDPYQARLDAMERRNLELESSLKRLMEGQRPQRAIVPAALSKHPDQWSAQDLREYNEYVIERRLATITQEQEWRGRLNAESLGAENDYDTVTKKYLYENEEIRSDPASLHFIRNLNPHSQYVLALVHEITQKSGADPVNVIKAIRNGLTARLDGARDVAKKLSSPHRNTQLGLISGGRGQPAPRDGADMWAGTDAEFLARRNRRG